MSSLALSFVLTERCDIDSPNSGWRWSSIVRDCQISWSREAVSSLNLLCLIDGNPNAGQDKVWSILRDMAALQLQCEGWLTSGQSYLRERASLNADLCITKLCLSTGSAVNHKDALFSLASSTLNWRLDSSWLWRILTSSFSFDCLSDFAVSLSCSCSDWQSSRDWIWITTCSTSDN